MKKTIITAALCLGMAATASAATVQTWSASDIAALENDILTITPGTITDTSQGDFAVTAILDATAVKTAISNSRWGIFLKVQDTDEEENYSFNLAINGSSSNQNDGIWTGLGTASNVSISDDISTGLGAAYAAGKDYSGMAITMSIGGNGTRFCLTLVDTNGYATSYTDDSKSSWHYNDFDLRQMTVTDTVTTLILDEDYLSLEAAALKNVEALKASGVTIAPAIPEPATATLSLLALAGLAARRRRK